MNNTLRNITLLLVIGITHTIVLQGSDHQPRLSNKEVLALITNEEYATIHLLWKDMSSEQRGAALNDICKQNRTDRCVSFLELCLGISTKQADTMLRDTIAYKKPLVSIDEPTHATFTRIDHRIIWETLKIVQKHALLQRTENTLHQTDLIAKLTKMDLSSIRQMLKLPQRPPAQVCSKSIPMTINSSAISERKYTQSKEDEFLHYVTTTYASDYQKASQLIIKKLNATQLEQDIYTLYLKTLCSFYNVRPHQQKRIKAIEINLYSILRTLYRESLTIVTDCTLQKNPVKLFCKRYPNFIRHQYPIKRSRFNPNNPYPNKRIEALIAEEDLTRVVPQANTSPSRGSLARRH